MAAGVAMIVTDVGGNAEAVEHGVSGCVVPPASPAALGTAILALAHDPARRRRLGDAARARVAQAFGLDGCVARYRRLYALVASGARRRGRRGAGAGRLVSGLPRAGCPPGAGAPIRLRVGDHLRLRGDRRLGDPAGRSALPPAGLARGQWPARRRRLGRLPRLRGRTAPRASGQRAGAPSSYARFWNAPIGIASAVYALTWPKPWTLIPLNAALHATAAALLFRLLRGFVADWRWAAVGVAPFVFFPSALVWVSQIHKDGFFIAGYFCLFVAWAELARHDPGALHWRGLGRALVLLPVGFGLIWLVRPDLTRVAHATAGLALGVLAFRIAVWIWRNPRRWGRGVAVLALAVLTTLAGAWLDERPGAGHGPGRSRAGPGHATTAWTPIVTTSGLGANWNHLSRGVRAIPWYRSSWLPSGGGSGRLPDRPDP